MDLAVIRLQEYGIKTAKPHVLLDPLSFKLCGLYQGNWSGLENPCLKVSSIKSVMMVYTIKLVII